MIYRAAGNVFKMATPEVLRDEDWVFSTSRIYSRAHRKFCTSFVVGNIISKNDKIINELIQYLLIFTIFQYISI